MNGPLAMATHLLRMFVVITGLTLCMLLPFLPGRYDSLAVPLSMMTQFFGIAGLLLVPVGVVWLAYESSSADRSKRRVFAMAAVVALTFVWGLTSLAAMLESIALGVGLLVPGVLVANRLWRRARHLNADRAISPWPVYLIVVPAAATLIFIAAGDRAAEFSRDRAIQNASDLIADIERYHAANGRYPASLVSVHADYRPGIMGIREYRYEPTAHAYNVLFEQHSLRLGIKEIVMYNPQGAQVISSHALDVLQLGPEQLALDRTRGHNAVHHARQPNWKFFWFD